MPRDPVCKIQLTPEGAVAEQEYRGITYYFCSQECKERFRQNPEAIRKENLQWETEGEVQTL